MRVTFTQAAEADLEEIGNFIAADDPLRAESFVGELVERCLGLAHHPLRHPLFVARAGREIRRFPHGNYVIFYSVLTDAVEIDHIVHAARDHIRMLFPEG
mgnify:FL=1|jgi:plasmid stabilization system protein ParE